ncbi:2-keto-4-pentenoate hydratase [Bradyrhizobium betae]|uniref:2-keto-4-pentenoate hydratase n=1 Tax=Bradyrhizobium betae TaxID=244734 RepID=A0A4Q1VNQ4_9BRAD|nr:fumarylacetoacetate hydrolase family protein [Bradyrhizobium betae]RXT54345.1 2-keto-4-pentenoate hydratase [Bradyrhizobium betae]
MDVEAVAARLRNAYTKGPIPPLRDVLEPTDEAGAYAVQLTNTRFWTASGRRPTGHKVGLTAKAVQNQLGVNQPDFGVLFGDMEIPNGETLNWDELIAPRAEAEVALIMGRDLRDPAATAETIAEAIAYAVPAIEIVDSRISDWKITFADTVADNGSSAFYVLGDAKEPLKDLDLYTCGMALEANGEIASVGAGAACLGHPLNAAAWLVRTLSRDEGLKAGDVVLTGALGPMVPLKRGDTLRAQIGGLGSCSFRVR